MLAQFDDTGQFTAVFIGPTDCLGGDVIDSKHQLNPRISARLPTLPPSGRDEEVRQGSHFGENPNSRPMALLVKSTPPRPGYPSSYSR